MRSITVVSFLASVVLAQNSPTSGNSGSSSLIPSGISSTCQSYLTNLNQDTSLSSCTGPLISAASAYGPGGNASSNPSKAAISSSLNSLCGSSTSACSENALRGKLADFSSACSAELTSKRNADVFRTYELLYVLTPFTKAVCSKNDNGDYCTQQPSSAASSVSPASLSNVLPDGAISQRDVYEDLSLTRRAAPAAVVPNITTFANSNLVFLFMQPSSPNTVLCTTCGRNVMTPYINFESDVPYAPGLASSEILSGQQALYSAMLDQCGKNFLSGVVQAAGSLAGNGPLSGSKSGAVKSISSLGTASIVIALGAIVGGLIV